MKIEAGKVSYSTEELVQIHALVFKDNNGHMTGLLRGPLPLGYISTSSRFVAEHSASAEEHPWEEFIAASMLYREDTRYIACVVIPIQEDTSKVLELVECYIQHRKSDWDGFISALEAYDVKHTVVYNTRCVTKAELEEELGYKIVFKDEEA